MWFYPSGADGHKGRPCKGMVHVWNNIKNIETDDETEYAFACRARVPGGLLAVEEEGDDRHLPLVAQRGGRDNTRRNWQLWR